MTRRDPVDAPPGEADDGGNGHGNGRGKDAQGMSIGEKVSELRGSRRLKLGEVYKECGISTGYLSKIEHGQAEPSREIVEKLARVFDDERLLGEYDGSQLERWGYPPVVAELIMGLTTIEGDDRDALLDDLQELVDRHLGARSSQENIVGHASR